MRLWPLLLLLPVAALAQDDIWDDDEWGDDWDDEPSGLVWSGFAEAGENGGSRGYNRRRF